MSGLRFERVSVQVGAFTLGPIEASAPAGGVTAVLGPNGCGKTTLLRLAVGLLRPRSGSVRLVDMLVTTQSEAERACRMAFVPQRPAAPPGLLVEEVVSLGRLRLPHDPAAIEGAMRNVGVWERRHERVETLSEGQRHRVAIARALAQCHAGTRLLVVDEPTAALDPAWGVRLGEILRERVRAGLAVLMATHDLAFAASTADQVLLLDHGSLVSAGPTAASLAAPAVTSLFGTPFVTMKADGVASFPSPRHANR
jgi:iron complex transport system ATP-binding protein